MTPFFSVSEEKKKLRVHFRALRASLDSDCKDSLDQALCQAILTHPLCQKASTLLLFYPVKGEPNLLPLAEDFLARGHSVGFPICDPVTHVMHFHAVSHLSELTAGEYGIPAPSPSGRILDDEPHALCLIPALSADHRGHRLGYGGGYYDRFLARFSGACILPIYHMLLSDTIPTDATDIPVGHILTEKGEIPLDA